MEYSQVSTDDEEVTETKRVVSSYNYYLYPCYFLEEAVRAFFKCLGIATKAQEEEKDVGDPKKIAPSTPQVELQDDDAADPSVPATDSSEADDPAASSSTTTQTSGVAVTVTARVVRPPLTGGRGGQIN